MEEDCEITKKSDSGEMSVKMCTMLETCDCGGPDCCSNNDDKKE